MSRSNKLKKQIKGYVRAQQLECARRVGHEEGRSAGYYEGHRAGHKAAMDDRTLYVSVPRSDVYGVPPPIVIGEEPKRDHVVIPFVDREDLRRSLRSAPASVYEQRVVFRAVRRGFPLPNGGTVIWWDWEARR